MIPIPERINRDQTETFRKMMEAMLYDLRVAAPGIIQSFDAATQTATVQLAIRERICISGDVTDEEIPELVDVPVVMPRAGGYLLTLPVAAGDECLVVFGDNCMDAWWQSGGVQNQVDRRRHDLSDGFAIVGIWSQPRVVSGYSANSAQLRNEAGDAMVEVAGSTINVLGGTVNVNADSTDAVNINGRVFMNHTHSGVEPGGGNTGGVV